MIVSPIAVTPIMSELALLPFFLSVGSTMLPGRKTTKPVDNSDQNLLLFPNTAATASVSPCGSPDLSKWDKIFSMLENSQMRENMLLQYADDIIKVEIGSLRGEMLRLVTFEIKCVGGFWIYSQVFCLIQKKSGLIKCLLVTKSQQL